MRVIAALFLSLGLMASLAACKPSGSSSSSSTSVSTSSTGAVTQEDMSLGDPNAKVTVIEYASLGCPVCAHWNNTVFQDFKTKYIDTGKVRYTLREFLTGDAPVASAGFLLARCAGASKYFQVVDAVWRQEEPLLESERNAEKRDALVKIATTWQGAGGIGGFFERRFAPKVMEKLYADELERFAAFVLARAGESEKIDEAGEESFPASDPPAF